MTVRRLAQAFGIGERTAHRYLSEEGTPFFENQNEDSACANDNTNNTMGNDDVVGDGPLD
jgi:hypothetical protein